MPVPDALATDRILAGMVYLGMWQERCLKMLDELDGEGDYLYVGSLARLLILHPGERVVIDRDRASVRHACARIAQLAAAAHALSRRDTESGKPGVSHVARAARTAGCCRRWGLPLVGVNFPGHFLVRYEGEAVRMLVDPFQAGELKFEDEAQTLLDRVYGGSVPLQPEYLQPATKKDIVARILANLKSIYLNAHDDLRALGAVDRLLVVHPDDPEELRDRGMILARLGRGAEAVLDLQRYLERSPGAADARRVMMLLEQLRPER